MTALTETTAPAVEVSEEVARGVALLDEKRPGWWRDIDLERLDIASGCNCVLGQCWPGGFSLGFDALLDGAAETPFSDLRAFVYDDYNDEWRYVIETLRKAEQ